VTRSARSRVVGWWWRRLPSLSRIGWTIATTGAKRPVAQTAFGVGLVGAGVVLRRNSRRRILYRGYIEPGTSTHIRVFKGDRPIYDRPLGS
jgi:hypothetical protein